MPSKLTIIGGGYAGIMLARAMQDHADITVIEPRDKWVHNVAMIRAMARPELLDQIIMPYDNLLKNGRIIHARATGIGAREVLLDNGEIVDGDLIVVATGSSYAAPFKMEADNSTHYLAKVRKIIAQINAAQTIAIIGGGAVGCELAGELAFARPEKTISLIAADTELFPAYPAKLGRSIARQLKELGVTVRLGERIKKLKNQTAPFAPAKGKLALSDGFPIAADLVIPVVGSRPETAIMQSLEAVEYDAKGRVKVDPWLRPEGHSTLFAVGDMASTGDGMTIVGLTRQIEWLTGILKAHQRGRAIEDQRPYRPWPKPVILLPLGPDKGASALPFGVVGPLLTSAIKGKKLFIPRYQRQFGYEP